MATSQDRGSGKGAGKNRSSRAAAVAEARKRQQRDERRRSIQRNIVVAVLAVAVIAGLVALAVASSHHHRSTSTSAAPLGPENIPLEKGTVLASASGAASGQTVDGIKCESTEQVAYHIHAHLAVYVNGTLRPIPIGIGIVTPQLQQTANGPFAGASKCYYWLHVHAQDGIIHVESPTSVVYTLGQFFDLWRQPLTATQVGPAQGVVTAYVNGVKFTGSARDIKLAPHATIQLDVGSTTPAPQPVSWSKSSL
jgi:hypothetical protein